MDIWSSDKLVLFLIFFIPGFISIKIYDLIIPGERRDFSKSILEAVGYSSLNFALLSWLIFLINTGNFRHDYQVMYYTLLVIIMFILPILWPIFIIKILSCKSIRKYVLHPTPSPWDYIFGKRESFWIIVHLKNGHKIGGIYSTKSFASSYPEEGQIYLEQVWKLDDNGAFHKPIDRSRGIVILKDEIIAVEFFK
jgi:hypothetical protein